MPLHETIEVLLRGSARFWPGAVCLSLSLWIYTMNRCQFPSASTTPSRARRILSGLALAALAVTVLPASAQSVRRFPADAWRGNLIVQQPPVITMDGSTAQLSPGARIYSTRNLIVRPASLVGQELVVNYLADNGGQVSKVWILTEAEAAERRKRASD